jgi:hypothetical protein
MLYRLKEGVLVENPLRIGKDSSIHGYGLDDIIEIQRTP